MSLSNLPREILLEISDYLDNAGTNSLVRTNSSVHYLLNESLYRRDLKQITERLTGSRSLIWGVQNRIEGTVQRAVDACRCLNPIPESFHIALQAAAYWGSVHFVEMLLNVDGIDCNFMGGPLQAAPILLAAEEGHSAIVALLLSAVNIDPDIPSEGYIKFTPLLYACWKRHVSIVRQLLAREDVDCNTLRSSWTPLTLACYFGNIEIVNLLLGRDDLDVNLSNGSKTPLITAVETGLVEVVESLLTRDDLKPNIVNNHGEHVLGHAVCLGKVDVVKLLLDHPSIDPNFMANGQTALMLAWQADMVKLLLEREGIEVNRQDSFGLTALCKAAFRGHSEIGKLLLEREDININLPDNLGRTPLFAAVSCDCLELVDLLLKKDGIDPNPKVIDSGRTPLAHACHFDGSTAIVRSLLSHPNTDPNAVDNNGVSILADFMTFRHFRVDSLQADEIKLLLRTAGAR
jgi:ankyrin repeat protein